MTTATSIPWLEQFAPLPDARTSRDPLAFAGYRERLDHAAGHTGASESVTCGLGTCGGVRVMSIVFDFDFLGGSMGEATGQRIVQAIESAIALRLPVLTIAASGGARMQEGMLSLVQMQAISEALNRLRAAHLGHLAVATHPTTGGVWVSLVSGADVILSEAGAEIAFSGSRVRRGDQGGIEFRAEGKFVAGVVDGVFSQAELPGAVARYLQALATAAESPLDRCPPPSTLASTVRGGRGWASVIAARHPDRPGAEQYLIHYFDDLIPISGDRVTGHDPGMLCGIGLREGRAVAYAAQTGGANTPAGFRTATRVIELAETLQIPVVTLLDTPGAQATGEAERGGVGTAIGELMRKVTRATVPITSLLIGEGGSGGALALAAPGELWATPQSYFSVLGPESAAAILYRDPGRAEEVANSLRVDPDALVEFGIARAVEVEPPLSSGIRAQIGAPSPNRL